MITNSRPRNATTGYSDRLSVSSLRHDVRLVITLVSEGCGLMRETVDDHAEVVQRPCEVTSATVVRAASGGGTGQDVAS